METNILDPSASAAPQPIVFAIDFSEPELSLSARQIDGVPPEIEDRLPDFWMNGNKAWVLAPETGTVAPTDAESAAA